MRFPDEVMILKPGGADQYGNPGRSFVGGAEIKEKGFLVKPDLLLLPANAAISEGDRVRINGRVFATDVRVLRTPTRTAAIAVDLSVMEAS
jgi:hypothetical protein